MVDNSNFLLCIAIDFGTTYSGYAFSFRSRLTNVKMNKAWGSNISATRYKTPTCVLTDQHDRFVAFGYEAHAKYMEDEDNTYHLFDKFKMSLYKEQAIKADMTIAATDGHRQPATTIIAMALRYFKDHVLQAIRDSDISTAIEDKIQWVLTVPAIWSDQAKQLMRKSAKQAGIIDSEAANNLMIALEPEAASLWCRQLPVSQFVDLHDNEVKMDPGTVYMVVDCGGGTADITVHEVCEGDLVKEVTAASGGDWGGTRVDTEFEMLLGKLFGEDVMHDFKTEYMDAWFRLMLQFDTAKRSLDTDEMLIQLPFTLMTILMKHTGKSKLSSIVSQAGVRGITTKGQEFIRFDAGAIGRLFDPVIDKIEEHIEQLLSTIDAQTAEYIYLVGGFGDCGLLQKQLKHKFNYRLKLLIPQEAGMVVLKGAVLFGHRPLSINSRIARKTYGLELNVPFDRSIHPPDKKIILDGNEYCTDVFAIWVKKGDEVKYDECVENTYVPAQQSSTEVRTIFYSASRTDVEYVTEKDVFAIGALTVKSPDIHIPRSERECKIKAYFGKTEIKVVVQSYSGDTLRDTQERTLKFV